MQPDTARIYLDWNATTPAHPRVIEAMLEAGRRCWGNPASTHGAGRAARAELEATRERLAALLGFHPRDVLFTGSGTEANNLALHDAPLLVTSRLEHPSVIAVAESLAARGVPVAFAQVGEEGVVTPEALERALRDVGMTPLPPGAEGGGEACGVRRPLVAVQAVNHETGVLQPLAELGPVVRRFGAGLHVDAVQLLGRGDVACLAEADSVSIAAHKLRGPKGIGALLWRPGAPPRPLLRGGAQERGLRPGTQDAAAAAGLGVALARVDESRAVYARLAPLRDALEAALAPWAVRNGAGERLPHVANLSFRGWRGDEVVAALDLEGIYCSSGSACSAGTTEPSAVIQAMVGRERAAQAVRFSLGEETSSRDVDRVVATLRRLLQLT